MERVFAYVHGEVGEQKSDGYRVPNGTKLGDQDSRRVHFLDGNIFGLKAHSGVHVWAPTVQ